MSMFDLYAPSVAFARLFPSPSQGRDRSAADVGATRLWCKFGRADVTRLLYAESLIVSYKQPRFEAGGHTIANRGARPNGLFLKMTAVEVESELALPVSGLPGTNVGKN
jgi:hypothetical protein